jgi:ribonuclease HI
MVDDEDNKLNEKYGGEKLTTNNRMELTAVIEALSALATMEEAQDAVVTVYTDSQYVKKGQTEWIGNWKKNGWLTASKTPVKNRELWKKLDALATRYDAAWRWVRGHAGNQWNERCDALTQQGIHKL